MTPEIKILIITAISIGFFHTLFGPDHYLPFIVMSKAKKWSYPKTILITFICGVGHVGSSVVLGLLGAYLGIAVGKLEIFESFRGNLAAWGLIVFGFVYFLFGVYLAIKNKPHTHLHIHQDGSVHGHDHGAGEHTHDDGEKDKYNYVPWVLFIVFVLGPCEPLIPLLMYPALKESLMGMVLVASVFSVTTILTMIGVVLIASLGFDFILLKKIDRYVHAIAGLTIFLCGMAIQFLGL